MVSDQQPPALNKANLSDYLAAERTFLAWIRTGLALMGFGFVIARFALFLQELQQVEHAPVVVQHGLSLWFGTAVIVLGVAVNIFAVWHHTRLVRQLNQGMPAGVRPSLPAIIVALLLALIGLAMAIYLASVRNSPGPVIHQETSMFERDNGIIDVRCSHSVDQTVEKLCQILAAKGVRLFALVDHSGEAQQAGMTMRPTKLLIFGSPKAGTPVMQASPSVALDLPLKMLVWEDGQGQAWISYNSPAYLQQRHGIRGEWMPSLGVVQGLANAAAGRENG